MAGGRKEDQHFNRGRAKRATVPFDTVDPRWARALRIERKNLLTKERRPNRPLLDRFADQLETDE